MMRLACHLAATVILCGACTSSPTMPTETNAPPRTEPTPAPAPAPAATAAARYRVTFESTWTSSTHPVDFPASAHFSSLVGGTHGAAATFWREGALASDGIKDMAERGATAPLEQEISAAIAAGTAERAFTGGALSSTPGSVSVEFEISQTHPLVTLVSMVAPSPDWFVGVSRLALFESGDWLEERRVALTPWDAGTTAASPSRRRISSRRRVSQLHRS